jgi:hypothetical protein
LVNFDTEYLICAANKIALEYKLMNSEFSKVSNLKLNKLSKIAITITSSTFFLYSLGKASFFKNILSGVFSCSS